MHQTATFRTCPQCQSGDYQFRNRKRIIPEPGTQGEELIETKYRCKSCSHEWRVRVTAPGRAVTDASR